MPGNAETEQLIILRDNILSLVIRLDAMLQLMIEKGVLTQEIYDRRIGFYQEWYERALGSPLPNLDSREAITGLHDPAFDPDAAEEAEPPPPSESEEMPETDNSDSDGFDENSSVPNSLVSPRIDFGGMDDFLSTKIPVVGGKQLPNEIIILDGHIILNDPESATRICSGCSAQNSLIVDDLGARQVCGLAELLTRHKPKKSEAFEGVNSRCWMIVIAGKMLEAIEEDLMSWDVLIPYMGKAAESVDFALADEISTDGIMSIIDCAVLEAQTSELEKEPTEDEGADLDIDWQH